MKTNVIYTHTQNKITVNMNHKYNEDKCDIHTHAKQDNSQHESYKYNEDKCDIHTHKTR